jgi:SAM-dependent methyltransferase
MSEPFLSSAYWNHRYLENQTGWDIGYASPALVNFALQFPKDSRILIPGCGKAWEAEALHEAGFTHVFILDFAPEALAAFAERVAGFPKEHLLQGDFFHHKGQYDLILEQTFFCAINRELRPDYVKQMLQLLAPGGLLAGLLFRTEFEREGPPFGGTPEEYRKLFESGFEILKLELCKNSILPRLNNEVWMEMRKPVT